MSILERFKACSSGDSGGGGIASRGGSVDEGEWREKGGGAQRQRVNACVALAGAVAAANAATQTRVIPR